MSRTSSKSSLSDCRGSRLVVVDRGALARTEAVTLIAARPTPGTYQPAGTREAVEGE
jgi:hypothetical protein